MSSAPERKDFAATKQMKAIMGKYFTDLGRAREEGRKTAWCTSVGPAELLRAMGFDVYFPENHGAMLGATRMATDLIPFANAQGFSPDICSYLTSDIGSYLKGETPLQKMGLTGVPKADVLVFNTNQCRDVKDWFQWYARQWNVPCLGVHTPRSIGDVDAPLVEYVAGQIEALIEPLERDCRARSSTSIACGPLSPAPRPARRAGSGCWKRRPTCRRPSRFSMARFRWVRPWCCAASRPRSITTSRWGPNWSSGLPTTNRPYRASGSACIGKACRSGASCAIWRRSSCS